MSAGEGCGEIGDYATTVTEEIGWIIDQVAQHPAWTPDPGPERSDPADERGSGMLAVAWRIASVWATASSRDPHSTGTNDRPDSYTVLIMPLTLPTHPIAVIPLKVWRPGWFDGVALVIGAVAPDVAYAADGYGVTIHSHAWHAPLWWALPLTLIGARLVRWAAPTIAVHLPAGGPFALRDYGVLATVRHRWHVTTISALLAAISHIGWDAFTHPTTDGGRVILPALHHQVSPGMPWWDLLSTASDLTGFAAGTALVFYFGRARLMRHWHGPPPLAACRPVVFWAAAALVLTIGLALLPIQPVRLFSDQAVRVMLITGLALLAGALAVRTHAATATPQRPAESTTPDHGPDHEAW